MPQYQSFSNSLTSHHGPPVKMLLHFGSILKKVNHKLTKGQDSEKILEFLFESLEILIPYDRIGIALVEGEGITRQVCSKWVKSKIPVHNLRAGYCAPLRGSSLEKIFETGQPRIINDLLDYAHEHSQSKSTQLILKDGMRSSLTCPLLIEDKPVGLVFFSSTQPQTYRNEHIQTYLEIADELSILVEHERLRKKFNNDLSRAQSLRMVLHDLKNPLGVIQGFLDLSQDTNWFQDLDSEAKNIFSVLQRNSNYMQELLNELSELSKIDIDVSKVEYDEIVLRDFIAELAIRGHEIANGKEISLSISAGSNLPDKVFFDIARVRRILDNLISNATKYSRRGTKIHIRINSDKQRLMFEIRDEGQGIPENEMSKLFCEFGRTSVRPTEGESSTGLGLAIVKKIVQQHGGQIFVQSQVGKGSTFTFWLPLHKKCTNS